ncbi:hypothetical protein PPYR_10112 [Photinus pyralis]|uniref:Uncharacterized protein n=1 Tax=Photinus pyralis TaxID=7054 RepID=A0A5N4AFG3_PHOPY|nr:hypothetical protein PPYR_10112 [Photinus pyralis]
MKIVVTLWVFIVAITGGSALKCYLCAGSLKSDCKVGKQISMVEQECLNFPNFHDFCIQGTSTKTVRPEVFMRGCAIIPKNETDPCKYLANFVPILGCQFCTTDFCNK